jgi:uncharacterized protein
MFAVLHKTLIVSAALSLLPACALSPAPPTHFYVLEAHGMKPIDSAQTVKKTVFGIGPITIPALLERKQIVTRSEQNAVQIAEFHQWAEPLRSNITQVITKNLAAHQAKSIVRAYPWSAYGSVNYRVIIDIDRFDTQPGHSVTLEARWSIMDEKSHAIINSLQTQIEHPLADSSYPGSVKALNDVLSEFSQQLALALDQLR